jgi:hypothetical protein
MPRKILVIHPQDFVGKTVTTVSVLHRHLGQNVEVLAVDSHNEGPERYGIPVQRFLGSEFVAIMQHVVGLDSDLIVDVAASEFRDFVEGLAAHPDALDDYTAVVMPLIPQDKVQRAAMTGGELLISLGLRPDRLRALFNRVLVRPGTTLEQCVECQFESFIKYAKKRGIPVYRDAALRDARVHGDLATEKRSLAAVLADENDYRALIGAAIADQRPEKEIRHLIRMLSLKRGAQAVAAEVDAAFNALRIPATTSVPLKSEAGRLEDARFQRHPESTEQALAELTRSLQSLGQETRQIRMALRAHLMRHKSQERDALGASIVRVRASQAGALRKLLARFTR